MGLFVRSKILSEIRIDRISEKDIMNSYSNKEGDGNHFKVDAWTDQMKVTFSVLHSTSI